MRLASVVVALACFGLACARTDVARVVELPEEPRSCAVADLDSAPLVVDLRADARADLESAFARGIVAVRYDCSGLRVVTDCAADGDYAFVGMTEKEQVVRFSSAAELQSNFPTHGAAIERERGDHEVDLAMAIVGTRTAQVVKIERSAFHGRRCESATHFVRRATVGAFGIAREPSGSYASIDSVIASSDSHDGALEACRAASASSLLAPTCASTLRVELEPLGGATLVAERKCAPGTVLVDDGVCAEKTRAPSHMCQAADLADCEAQCKLGSLASCAIAGHAYQIGRGVRVDVARAHALLTHACDGGSAQGCYRLAEMREHDGALDEARDLYDRSCRSGWLPGCESLGQLAASGPNARADAALLFRRACAGGNYESCASLGKLHELGLGVVQSDAEATRLYALACSSGATRRACVNLSAMIERGHGLQQDPARAIVILDDSCRNGASDSCSALSLHYFEGRGVTRDPIKGVELLVRACEGNDRGSCLPLAMRYQGGIGVAKDGARAKTYFARACDAGLMPACQQALR